jgi:hypothetical protein
VHDLHPLTHFLKWFQRWNEARMSGIWGCLIVYGEVAETLHAKSLQTINEESLRQASVMEEAQKGSPAAG